MNNYPEKVVKIFLASSITCLMLAFSTEAISASEAAISLSPSVIIGHLQSGSAMKNNITLMNTSANTEHITMSTLPFKDSGTGLGEVSYALNPPKTAFSFGKEVKLSDNGQNVDALDLQPHEKKTLTVDIQVPTDTAEEEQELTLLFHISTPVPSVSPAPTPGVKSAMTQLALTAGIHIILSLNASNNSNLLLHEFSVPTYAPNSTVPIYINLANNGEHFAVIRGTMVITDTLGRIIEKAAIGPTTILGRSNRMMRVTDSHDLTDQPDGSILWHPQVLFGKYTIAITLSNTDSKSQITATRTVIGFPLRDLIAIGGILFIFAVIKHRLRRYA